jgi:hypothetical protein
MRPVRNFDEFIEEQTVRKQSPDKSRANSLIHEAERTEKFLWEVIASVGITDENANNIIKIAYDIIMEKIRAKLILNGYHTAGQGAHEAEVSYLRELNFNERDVQFLDQLRYFRNGIMYYGKFFDKDYAEKTVKFLEKIK